MNLRIRNKQPVEKQKAPLPRQKTTEDKINFKNKNVCISGTIPGMSRANAYSKLRSEYGAYIHNTVISSTDYLITGFGVGQIKIAKAYRWGVTIIDAKDVF